MTYDNKAIRVIFLSWFPSLRARILLLLLLLTLLLLPLEAASLMYDQSTGSLIGFNMHRSDNPATPQEYKNDTETYAKDGFVGRLLYIGEPTTFTFYNVGATGPTIEHQNDMFYFIHTNRNDRWREFFLVIRAKGLRRDGAHIKIEAINSIIAGHNETYTLCEGAGNELVADGEYGYNPQGVLGKFVNGNEYKYRYKYSYIWIDTTIIHTSNKNGYAGLYPAVNYYTCNLGISTTNGQNLILNLQGQHIPTGPEPFTYSFSIDKYYTSPISYNLIKNRNSKDSALEIASISYISMKHNAEITIASDAAGLNSEFYFKTTTGEKFRFYLAFQSTIPTSSVVAISDKKTFESKKTKLPSPIGGDDETTNNYTLEGKIKLFTSATTVTPITGVYSSTIYVLVKKKN